MLELTRKKRRDLMDEARIEKLCREAPEEVRTEVADYLENLLESQAGEESI